MWRDDAYLLDILIAVRKVLRYAEGVTPERFRVDEVLQDAVVRNLQILGEAARKVSEWQIARSLAAGVRNRYVSSRSKGNATPVNVSAS